MFESPSQFAALRLACRVAGSRVPASSRNSGLAFLSQDWQLFVGSNMSYSRVPASSRHSDWPVALLVRESQPVRRTLDVHFFPAVNQSISSGLAVIYWIRLAMFESQPVLGTSTGNLRCLFQSPIQSTALSTRLHSFHAVTQSMLGCMSIYWIRLAMFERPSQLSALRLAGPVVRLMRMVATLVIVYFKRILQV